MTEDTITKKSYRLVILWAVVLALLYAVVAYLGTQHLRGYQAQTAQVRKTWLETTTAKDGTGPLGNITNAVRVGIYVNRIGDIALRESSWTADFDLWFHWTDKKLNPGETFQISNGEVEAREKREGKVNGTDRYERYNVRARIAKHFDPTRFPFAAEPLVIQAEDGVHGIDALVFVADAKNSGISPTAITYDMVKLKQVVAGVRLHDFGSTRGQPGDGSSGANVYSQFVFAMLVDPPGALFHLKLFHVLFSSVAMAVLALYIKPIHVDPRFGLGVGAFFAGIGNMIALASLMPRAQHVTLADMLNMVGLATIFLTLVQSTISLYLYDTLGLEKLSRFFDKVSFVVFLAGFAAINLALPLAASP